MGKVFAGKKRPARSTIVTMKLTTETLDERRRKAIAEHGESLLKMFHDAYQANPVGTETEFRRGQFIEWRRSLPLFYDERTAEEMIEAVSEKTRLTIPHAGTLSEDGAGYMGWDSGCHTYIGRLE